MTDAPPEPFVDRATRDVLGIDGYLDRCDPDTDPGRRALETPTTYGPDDRTRWRAEIDALAATERWIDDHDEARDGVRRALARLPDISSVATRLDAAETDPLRKSDLFQLKQFTYFGRRALSATEGLVAEFGAPADWPDRLTELSETIHPGGVESPRFHLTRELDDKLAATLDRKDERREALDDLRDPLEADIVDRFGGSFDLAGRYRPDDSTDTSTLEAADALEHGDDGWRLASEEVEALEAQLADVTDDLEAVERRVRSDLTEAVAEQTEWLVRVAELLCNLDVRLAKVRLRREIGGCWPQWRKAAEQQSSKAAERKNAPKKTSRFVVRIEGGRDPRLAEIVEDGEVQPIDFELGDRPAVITGPNMGGKSSLLVLGGLCIWCAQHAMPVPADGFAFRPVHGIRYVGSEEPTALDADEGLSSFGREIRRLVETRESSDAPTLWLLDEIGRGTHPDDGSALAIDVIERLDDDGHDIFAATHFPDVAAHEAFDLFQIRGIVDPDLLHERLDGMQTVEQMEMTLRDAMDFQPDAAEAGSVPRGARIVAAALGLDFESDA